jgi:hypothetical protein
VGGDHSADHREANRYHGVYEPVVENGSARVDGAPTGEWLTTRRSRPSAVSAKESAHTHHASQVAARELIPPGLRPELVFPVKSGVAACGLTTAPLVRSIRCERSRPFVVFS